MFGSVQALSGPDDTGRRPRYEQSSEERDLEALQRLRDRASSRSDAVPEERPDERTPTMPVLSLEVERAVEIIYDKIEKRREEANARIASTNNRIMEVAAQHPKRTLRDRLIEGALPVVLGGLLAWLGRAYVRATDEISAMHDEQIVEHEDIEQIKKTLEKTTLVIPRVITGNMPAPSPGKELLP